MRKEIAMKLVQLNRYVGIIRAATDDFSENNKPGQGGFGLGKLQKGQEIAVKRLLRDSGQGEQEFKKEVLLLVRLQHWNLVLLLEFSLEGSKQLLMYGFVQNASLHKFIFGKLTFHKNPTKSVAKGLLYLHEDSRLKIIHRDPKASYNILLYSQMNPKIEDFSMARLFRPEETQANTSRIVGTYGCMAPDYTMHGQFSVKSEMCSVLVYWYAKL
ncbi:putative non-specific protein-tyrosine kinase RLK-Pelle-DLSV family [Helianthus annuus]|nr:putative non-specific protein-tyrosine kinase RLK-Pelle-DLSV family [Helianthus annuus]